MGVPMSVFDCARRPKEERREVMRALREEADMDFGSASSAAK
jgi:hypothetical protein